MKKKTILIACEGAALLDLKDLTEFQGNLKALSETDHVKLRNEILELGFSFPFSVWQHGGTNYILDGHQRHRVLSKLAEEGYVVPKLPVSLIIAKNLKEAKNKLLGAASNYGRIDAQGLVDFLTEAEINFDAMAERMRFPDVDFDLIKSEFFDDPSLSSANSDDPNRIGGYTPDADFFSVRINSVKPSEKDQVVALVNQALEAQKLAYRAEAF